MLSWEMEDDLGLGGSKVETLDSSNTVSLWMTKWAPTTSLSWKCWQSIESRVVSIKIQNRADLCHQVMTNYSQD